MTILVGGLIGTLLVTGGYAGALGPTIPMLMDPYAAAIVETDGDPLDVDPDSATLAD